MAEKFLFSQNAGQTRNRRQRSIAFCIILAQVEIRCSRLNDLQYSSNCGSSNFDSGQTRHLYASLGKITVPFAHFLTYLFLLDTKQF